MVGTVARGAWWPLLCPAQLLWVNFNGGGTLAKPAWPEAALRGQGVQLSSVKVSEMAATAQHQLSQHQWPPFPYPNTKPGQKPQEKGLGLQQTSPNHGLSPCYLFTNQKRKKKFPSFFHLWVFHKNMYNFPVAENFTSLLWTPIRNHHKLLLLVLHYKADRGRHAQLYLYSMQKFTSDLVNWHLDFSFCSTPRQAVTGNKGNPRAEKHMVRTRKKARQLEQAPGLHISFQPPLAQTSSAL